MVIFNLWGFVISGLYFWEVWPSLKFSSFIRTDLFDWMKFCVKNGHFDTLIYLYTYVLYMIKPSDFVLREIE